MNAQISIKSQIYRPLFYYIIVLHRKQNETSIYYGVKLDES